MTALDSAIKEAIAPIIAEANLFLEALQISTAGKHRIIRILVDHQEPGKGLSLDEVTAVTKPISAELDSLAALGERPFTLEVSSPGVDFPLSLPRHWVKNRGRLATITLQSGTDLTGRIIESDDEHVKIESKKGEISEHRYADIARANIEVEFK